MERPLVSVIVPVYNVSHYLNKCIDSILCQTYKNLEIILVDDGSTDNSGKICDEYAHKDNRIIVIHKGNGGLSSARNAAIDIMTGAYMTCVDSDDYITNDYVEYLYDLLINNNVDISICHFKEIFSDKDKLDQIPEKTEILSNKDAIKYCLYQKKFTASACCKLYKSYLFNSLRYPVGKYYEDMAIICQLLDSVPGVVIGSEQKYYYVQRKNSIMRESFNPKKMHRIETAEKIRLYISQNHPDLIKAANARCFLAAVQTFKEVPLIKKYKKYTDLIWEKIVKYRFGIIIDANAKMSHRLIGMSTYGGRHCLNALGSGYSFFQYIKNN